MPRTGDTTPWGTADSITKVGLGIEFVTTPSHGGYYVPNDQLRHIPTARQAWAKGWSGSVNWYEEDCCWAAVAEAFPELFPDGARENARLTLAHYFEPKEVAV